MVKTPEWNVKILRSCTVGVDLSLIIIIIHLYSDSFFFFSVSNNLWNNVLQFYFKFLQILMGNERRLYFIMFALRFISNRFIETWKLQWNEQEIKNGRKEDCTDNYLNVSKYLILISGFLLVLVTFTDKFGDKKTLIGFMLPI